MIQNYDINFVMAALSEAGWELVQTDPHWLLIPVDGKHGSFFISFYFHPTYKMLFARGNIAIYVPENQQDRVLEFINYANYRVPIGNFELGIDNQNICFRVGMFFENMTLNAQLLHNVVYEVSQAVQDFWLAVKYLVQEKATIEQAFSHQGK
jgi:hypothetical protein